MALRYRLESGRGLILADQTQEKDTPVVEIVTPEEFTGIDLGDADVHEALRLLAHSKGTFANLLPDCIIGSLSLLGKEDEGLRIDHFGFFLSAQRLVFIDEGDACEKILAGLGNLSKVSSITSARVLFELVKHSIQDDAQFLTGIERKLSDIEEQVIEDNAAAPSNELLGFRRRLLRHDRSYQQLTDMALVISKDEYLLLTKDDRRLFRLLSQQTERLFQRSQYLKEYSLQLRELYQMQIDVQQNKTIQWLTVITTLVVPLTLISSWYGMNFVNMPELDWPYSYYVVIAVCIVLVIVQLVFFKKRKWL